MCTVCFYREQRTQRETEAKEQRQREAAVLRQQELDNYIKEKEREILQLQVNYQFLHFLYTLPLQ